MPSRATPPRTLRRTLPCRREIRQIPRCLVTAVPGGQYPRAPPFGLPHGRARIPDAVASGTADRHGAVRAPCLRERRAPLRPVPPPRWSALRRCDGAGSFSATWISSAVQPGPHYKRSTLGCDPVAAVLQQVNRQPVPGAGGRRLWRQRLEGGSPRPVHRLERCPTRSAAAPGGQQRPLPDPALGAGAQSGFHGAGAHQPAAARRLAGSLRLPPGCCWRPSCSPTASPVPATARPTGPASDRPPGKLDIHHQRQLPTKDIWLYPLRRDFRRLATARPARPPTPPGIPTTRPHRPMPSRATPPRTLRRTLPCRREIRQIPRCLVTAVPGGQYPARPAVRPSTRPRSNP